MGGTPGGSNIQRLQHWGPMENHQTAHPLLAERAAVGYLVLGNCSQSFSKGIKEYGAHKKGNVQNKQYLGVFDVPL